MSYKQFFIVILKIECTMKVWNLFNDECKPIFVCFQSLKIIRNIENILIMKLIHSYDSEYTKHLTVPMWSKGRIAVVIYSGDQQYDHFDRVLILSFFNCMILNDWMKITCFHLQFINKNYEHLSLLVTGYIVIHI